MDGPTVTRWQLKLQAKQALGRNPKPFFALGGTMLLLLMLTFFLQSMAGGLMVFLPLDLASFPMETGAWRADASLMGNLLSLGGLAGLSSTGGMVFSLRLEATGMAMVLLMPWSLILSFIGVQLLVLLVTSPFRLGAMEQLWGMLSGQASKPRDLFRWYTDLRLTGKALGVELVLCLWQWITRLALTVPGIALLVLGSRNEGNVLLLTLSLILSVAGPLVGYYLYCLLLPAQYVLAKRPGLSPLEALRKGAALFKGKRAIFFTFRLSFLPWNVVSAMLSNLPDAYVFPYEEASCMLLINAVLGPSAVEE